MAETRKLSNKERMEMFQSGVSQLTTENDVSNVRELLRQRYIKAKAEEDEAKRKQAEESAKRAQEEKNKPREMDTSKMGKQLARVFRFGSSSNTTRQRHTAANRGQRRPEIDPFDDPNVLMQNFGFEDEHDHPRQHQDGDQGRFPFFNEQEEPMDEDDEEDDDSFRSLVRMFVKNLTWTRLVWILFKLTLYITCQVWAYKTGFGAACFAVALLIFICTNLRNRAPGELSAYSVFNPFCRPIASTVGDGQPQDNIVLLGNL